MFSRTETDAPTQTETQCDVHDKSVLGKHPKMGFKQLRAIWVFRLPITLLHSISSIQ